MPKSVLSETTSRHEPENRAGNEYDVEVRDIIQAIILSLFHPQPTAAAPAQTSSKAAPVTDVKGKGKTVSFDVPTPHPTYNEVANSLAQIRKIEASFQALESDFVFPRILDFTPPSSPTSSDTDSPIKLTYTSHNAPIHNYTHALSVLLTQLDAIESFGSDDVRHRRKEVVDKVEQTLEGVERVVEEKGRLSRRSSQETMNKVGAGEERERKASAKEFVVTAAFTSSFDAQEEVSVQRKIEPTIAVSEPPSDFSDLEGLTANNASAAVVEGYSVTDDDKDSESYRPVLGVVAGSVEQPAIQEEAQATPSGDCEEQVNTVGVAIVKPSSPDADEKAEHLSATDNAEGAVSSTFLHAEVDTPAIPHEIVVHPDGSDETFLLTASSSPEFPLKRPNVTEDDVDEGSDWSEVEA